MVKHLPRTISFLKATAIGGLLFLLPFAGVVFILSYVYKVAQDTYKAIDPWLPDFFHSGIGIAILFVVAVAIVVGACFLVGLFASRSIAKEGTQWLESNLLKVFPKYAIYKDILAGSLGSEHAAPSMKPVYVMHQGLRRLAFETNRQADGSVAIYFPGSPDPWSGFLAYVPAEDVQNANLSFSDAVSQLEQLGRAVVAK
jgi:uncharacterized membrane protein